MTKIKNFRIALRAREIARWLKKERGLETTPDLEISIERLINEAKAFIEPAALYSTLTKPVAEKATAIPFPDKAIAVSVIVVSIGSVLNQKQMEAKDDTNREPLLAALELEALNQSLAFASRLIQDQAKEEDCELSPSVVAVEPAVASSLASLVGVQRIGIDLDPSANSFPSYARVAWLFWTPEGKGASRRAEKAVV
jgi:hypothetical protein